MQWEVCNTLTRDRVCKTSLKTNNATRRRCKQLFSLCCCCCCESFECQPKTDCETRWEILVWVRETAREMEKERERDRARWRAGIKAVADRWQWTRHKFVISYFLLIVLGVFYFSWFFFSFCIFLCKLLLFLFSIRFVSFRLLLSVGPKAREFKAGVSSSYRYKCIYSSFGSCSVHLTSYG